MRALIVALSLLLLAGCSTVKLVYNNLDTLANWAADDAVDFSDGQEALFDTEFAALWHWHRTTQLAAYAADLRRLADEVARPMSVAQVQQNVLRANRHVETLFEAGLPPMARLLVALGDSQMERLLAEVVKQSEQNTRERAALTPEQRQQQTESDMRRALKDWIGTLTEEQTARVAGWVQSRRVQPEQWLDYQDRWVPAFRTLLAGRGDPGFEARLRAHFEGRDDRRDAALNEGLQHDREQWFALMSELSASLTPKQRTRFQERLRDLADDLEELSANES